MIRHSQWVIIVLLALSCILATWLIDVPEGLTDTSDRHFLFLSFTDSRFSYFLHHVLTVVPVALLSFEHRIHYVSRWKKVIVAAAVPALLYLMWDVLFTDAGVWAFDHEKTMGLAFLGLPWEEWASLFVIPFACVFIYENLLYYLRHDPWAGRDRWISFAIGFGSLIMALYNNDKLYTFLAFFSASAITLWDLYFYPERSRTRFYMTFAISLVPMIIFNGWLTGMFSSSPLVSYDPESFMGWRVFTMPLEDIFFGYGYLFLVIRFYQQIVNK
jgi:lycopene cyclase domain-containing protein